MRFSIIVPTYNLENYIKKSLESILNQTFTDYEIIIIDDGSTDKTVEIIQNYVDYRIKLLHAPRLKAPGLVRNIGLEIASGEYILFLDGDDWYVDNTCLERLDKGCQGEDIVYFDFIFGREGRKQMSHDNRLIYCACWNKAWRREFIKNMRFPTDRVGEDLALLCYALDKQPKEGILSELIVHYNYPRENSVIWSYWRNQQWD